MKLREGSRGNGRSPAARRPAGEDRAAVADAAIRAYMDLFVLMQSAAFSHWLMMELTFAQARALILLAARGELTVGQLAGLLSVGKSTASILVQQLVERGLVSRGADPGDRRVSVLRLSPQGQEIGAGRRRAREAQWRTWMGQLTNAELSALRRGLEAFRRVAERHVSRAGVSPRKTASARSS